VALLREGPGMLQPLRAYARKRCNRVSAKSARQSRTSYTNLAAIQLADVLAGLTPGDLDRFYFC
jgi:hypothetical protein